MRLVVAAVLLAVLSGSGAAAGGPEKKEADKKKEDKQEVITNETLKRKYGEPEPARPLPEAGKSETSPEPVQPKPAMTEPERSKRITELRKEQARLQRRIQSLKNPFLPRVPLTEEEQKAEEGKGSDERVRMLEERLARMGQELKELEEPPGRSR